MDKRTFLAILLSMAVIFVYSKLVLPPPKPVLQPPAVQEGTDVDEEITIPAPEAGKTAPSEIPVLEEDQLEDILIQQEEAEGREVNVANGLFEITLDNRGATVSSWKLLAYPNREGTPAEMAPEKSDGGFGPLDVVFGDGGLTGRFNQGVYVVEGEDILLTEESPEGIVTLSRIDATGLKLTKELTFQKGSYMVDFQISLANIGEVPLEIPWWVYWGPGLGRSEAQKGRFYTGPLTHVGQKVVKDKPKKDGERITAPAGFDWLGVTNQYFLVAFISSGEGEGAFIERNDKTSYSFGVGPQTRLLPPGGQTNVTGRFFVGPKSYDLLKTYDLGLDKAIDFGWFGVIGLPLFKVLKFFHRFVGNWGLAIILMTLLVKVILFPVSFNMYRSMRRMQSIQPQLQSIRKKYKDDPQTMNQEMMSLYRTHKVNPFGGCLPMVIQIPIFFALYKVLYIAIELRGAGFLHIKDLSGPEPFKVFVILMGLSMFLQQRLSPTMGDPRQAKFMMFMPIMFTALFWNFSSGLVVYFLFSNLMAISEQMLIKKLTPGETVAKVPDQPQAPKELPELPKKKRSSRRKKKK